MASIGILGFKLLEKIGEGGMAEVYKARQLSLDRIVAVKILRADMAADPSALAQFRMEANAVAHLKHTNIVQVHEAGCRDDIYYFVMEYVAGYSVADWIERKGRLPEDDALLVAEYTARALDYAWEHSGLIHGDIKPDNVLVDEDGAIKIADFSGLHGVGRGPADQPVDDDIIGTPNYMSPEQARGERDLDIRSDMYAVGALLYHMVTGRIPFRNRDERAVMAAQAEDFLPNPRELEPSVSPACALLIRKLMSKSRADRPASRSRARTRANACTSTSRASRYARERTACPRWSDCATTRSPRGTPPPRIRWRAARSRFGRRTTRFGSSAR